MDNHTVYLLTIEFVFEAYQCTPFVGLNPWPVVYQAGNDVDIRVVPFLLPVVRDDYTALSIFPPNAVFLDADCNRVDVW